MPVSSNRSDTSKIVTDILLLFDIDIDTDIQDCSVMLSPTKTHSHSKSQVVYQFELTSWLEKLLRITLFLVIHICVR